MIMRHSRIIMVEPSQIESTRESRRRAILALLDEGPVPSQGDLARRLESLGLGANQATLSRDLRDMGVVKGPAGYFLTGAPTPVVDAEERLRAALRQYLRGVTPAANQVVLHTPPGGAQPLALALDGAAPDKIVGTLAGDDTILVITPDASSARAVASWLEDLV